MKYALNTPLTFPFAAVRLVAPIIRSIRNKSHKRIPRKLKKALNKNPQALTYVFMELHPLNRSNPTRGDIMEHRPFEMIERYPCENFAKRKN